MFILSLDFFYFSSELYFSYVFDLSAGLFYFILLNSLNYYLDKKDSDKCIQVVLQWDGTLFKATL